MSKLQFKNGDLVFCLCEGDQRPWPGIIVSESSETSNKVGGGQVKVRLLGYEFFNLERFGMVNIEKDLWHCNETNLGHFGQNEDESDKFYKKAIEEIQWRFKAKENQKQQNVSKIQ